MIEKIQIGLLLWFVAMLLLIWGNYRFSKAVNGDD